MYNDDNALDLKKRASVTEGIKWANEPVEELLRIRGEIDLHLPPIALKDMNMEQEMTLQLRSLAALQNKVLTDDKEALNQRVALANSVTNMLAKLTDLQKEIYTTERFKMIENALIKIMGEQPEEIATAWIEKYEQILERMA